MICYELPSNSNSKIRRCRRDERSPVPAVAAGIAMTEIILKIDSSEKRVHEGDALLILLS
jgi:hypothetical protein